MSDGRVEDERSRGARSWRLPLFPAAQGQAERKPIRQRTQAVVQVH